MDTALTSACCPGAEVRVRIKVSLECPTSPRLGHVLTSGEDGSRTAPEMEVLPVQPLPSCQPFYREFDPGRLSPSLSPVHNSLYFQGLQLRPTAQIHRSHLATHRGQKGGYEPRWEVSIKIHMASMCRGQSQNRVPASSGATHTEVVDDQHGVGGSLCGPGQSAWLSCVPHTGSLQTTVHDRSPISWPCH